MFFVQQRCILVCNTFHNIIVIMCFYKIICPRKFRKGISMFLNKSPVVTLAGGVVCNLRTDSRFAHSRGAGIVIKRLREYNNASVG